MTCAAGCSRHRPGTAAAPATRCMASAGCCAAASTTCRSKARARLEAGLIAGDPDGEVTIAWTIAQQVMDLYQLDDPAQARARAADLIDDAARLPDPRTGPPRAHPARLARRVVRALRPSRRDATARPRTST